MTARKLVQSASLPEYMTSADRIARIGDDIRDLTAQMKAQLTAKAYAYNISGWGLDDESWELAANRDLIVLTVTLTRPDA